MSEHDEILKEQWEKASPLIGPLLDAWDGIPNDCKGYVEEEAPRFVRLIRELSEAMGPPTK